MVSTNAEVDTMTERSIELVPSLIRGQKSNGHATYDPAAKTELVRRDHQPGVSVAGLALANGVNANPLRKGISQAARAPRGFR